MDPDNSTTNDLKSAILADSQLFLARLESGASEEQLTGILEGMRKKELQLIEQQGIRLSPELWNILHNRLANRRDRDIIDTGR